MSQGVVPTYPPNVALNYYYSIIDALTNAQGVPTDLITPDKDSVKVSGITDAGSLNNATIQVYLIGYQTEEGLPERAYYYSVSLPVTPTDLDETDSVGNELYSWTATLPTTGLTPGIYALESFVDVTGFLETGSSDTPVQVSEDNTQTVTVGEFDPFTYVVQDNTEVVTVGTAQLDSTVLLSGANATVQLSTDGRYAVWTSGDEYQQDLQTGAVIDLTATGIAAPTLATNHSPTENTVDSPDPYGAEGNGAYEAITYPTFVEGGVTFSSAPDYDFNANNGSENPLPTVTDAGGNTAILATFGVSPTMVGYATAASDNGNAVLTVENSEVTYFTTYGTSGVTTDPQYYITYRSPAPTLTLAAVNGSNQFSSGASSVTLTGTSNAIGQIVEIDFQQAGIEVGTATVQANGSWSYTFDPSKLIGSSLFIEASVSSAGGTPAEVSETAQISDLPLPTLTSITGQDENGGGAFGSTSFGPTETLTVTLDTSETVYVTGTPTLTLSNGAYATYRGGSGTDQITFTYVPAIGDAGSSNITVTGLNLPAGATIADADGDPLTGAFSQALGLTLVTAPDIASLSPVSETSNFLTNSDEPTVTVGAEVGETITLYDNGTAIGSGIVPDYGVRGIGYIDITTTVALPEGNSALTAIGTDGAGNSSPTSTPITITVDTTPPAEKLLSLMINGTDTVDLSDQAKLDATITGRLDSPLKPGESVVIVFPDGQTQTVTPAAGVTGFSLTASAFQAESFGVSGAISASVVDAAGNKGITTTQAYTADGTRVLKLVSADPADPSTASESFPALSGNGQIIAFQVQPVGGEADALSPSTDADPSIAAGVYTENLSTGAVTLQAAGGGNAALSSDGTTLAYVDQSSYPDQLFTKSLTTGTVTLVSAANGAASDGAAASPSLSADGSEVAFLSNADNLVAGVGAGQTNDQVYVATLSGGALAGMVAVSVAADGTQSNGTASDVSLSGDGSEVAFASTATNLLAASDAHSATLNGRDEQIYVKAQTTDTASGLVAGQIELVTGNADGSVGDGTSYDGALSADGRYLAFISTSDNLAPANLLPGTVLPAGYAQVYVKDLLTGQLTLVSQTPNGIVGDNSAQSVSISGDGQTIVFTDNADNLGNDLVGGQQVYEATLSDGVVTGLTLVSEAGAIPSDGQTEAAALSSDGTRVAFQSSADNLVSGIAASAFGTPHVYTALISPAAPPATQPTSLTVTNTNDSGVGSLRASLSAAHDGDTITFASNIVGGTITLASSLTLTTGVTIDGLGSNINVSGGNAVTVFNVALDSEQSALIEGLTIEDGAGIGAAGANASAAANSTAGTAAAGGIDLSQGHLSLVQDSFVGNTAIGGDGGSDIQTGLTDDDGESGADAGGAILVGGGATLAGSDLTFSSNVATGGAGGVAQDKATGGGGGAAAGAIFAEQGSTVSLANLTLSDNRGVGGDGGTNDFEGAAGTGGNAAGGLFIQGNATASGNGVTFSGNTGTGGNGGQLNTPNVGYKAAGLAGNAAGAIYADSPSAITPINFAYTGDSATTGYDGQGTLGSAGAPESQGANNNGATTIYAYAYSDTNLSVASTTGPTGATGEDGYLVGATVSYQNGSGTPVTTDALGGFTLTGGTGPIMLTGGVDNATGLPFTGTLTAPAGSTIISPLTTLVEAVAVASGDTSAAGIAAANALVVQAFGLPAGTDLTSLDAEGSLSATRLNAAALQTVAAVFEADNYLGSADTLITAAGGSADTTMTAIAQRLATGQTLDLTDPSTLVSNAGLSAAATTAIVDIATTTINTVETQIGSGAAPAGIFQAVSGASIADQSNAAEQLSIAARTGTDAAFEEADTTIVAPLPQTIATDDGQVACFARGTRIATGDGPIAIEDLDVGDLVLTLDGRERVTWIGFREVHCHLHSEPRKVYPICIEANAFGKGQPSRDLFLSPDHAIYRESVLIPVKHLINGTTVRQVPMQTVGYYHIELPRHAILLADGLATESYLETGDRQAFEDSDIIELHPAWGSEARDITLAMDASGYAPLQVTGRKVDRVRALLAAQARRQRDGRLA
ncbi:Hint domain-containing protein [Acidisoma silvae]|uniref:Hint domain-containing protein n=1 Tax=Acidisoma silvae TaxID=2802396 RepID=A0A964E191_9PROT|nr:Hint domain-containing protein [Acidisoma silvae]MCB8878101.1 Hint domain-containing protein [Acidisoma silvae]